MAPTVRTIAPYWNHRHLPATFVADFARQMSATGLIDFLNLADVLANWWPQYCWDEHVPAAKVLPDCDSPWDGYIALALASAAAPELDVLMGANAARHGPAESWQSMMTLASITDGEAICQLGTGEAYNVVPFGYRRGQGIARLEDHLRLYRLLWECDGPFDFDGRVWKYEGAYVGTIRDKRPKFYAMGSGPKLRDLAARYADGWTTLAPGAFRDAEAYAEAVRQMKVDLERYGRDPDDFGFGLCIGMFVHEDPEVRQTAIDNAAVRWFSAQIGRITQSDWTKEGLEPIFPDDYSYTLHMLPTSVPKAEFDRVTAAFDQRYMEKSYLMGSPAEVAAQLQPWLDAGASLLQPCDPSPFALEPEGAQGAMDQLLELYRILKAA